ncbi:MAG: tRNA pseudouridine(55) synthase TruB [Candidatus Saganbacteria bacterium]|nr:tRNA pseudouridine(55) synthase TruB [Candidatus Saganbacteria bacterium]
MNGILLIDKPQNLTSFDVVKIIRKLTGVKKVGHGGTLDPMATGILLIFLGAATKKAKHFIGGDKAYIAEMTLGIMTDTLDADGKTIKSEKINISNLDEKVKKAFKEFTGEIVQIPPMFSAIHHKGKRLYEFARAGIEVERKERKVMIHELILKGIKDGSNPRISFEVQCSKGTYIRSLALDVALRLGSFAYLSKLRRTYSHPFVIEQALPLETVENLARIGKLAEVLIDPEDIFKNG